MKTHSLKKLAKSILLLTVVAITQPAHADLETLIAPEDARVACQGYDREMVISGPGVRYSASVSDSGYTYYPTYYQGSEYTESIYASSTYQGDGFKLVFINSGREEERENGWVYQRGTGVLSFRQKDRSWLTIETECLVKYYPTGGGMG